MSSDSQFDDEIVRKLAEILKETDLTEIEVERDNCRVRVARQISVNTVLAPEAAPSTAANAPAGTAAPSETTESSSQDVPEQALLKAPMVGNVYLAAAPDADPYVKVGDVVKKGDTVMIIEAMKVMNQIKAHKDGTIVSVLVDNGETVEYGQSLAIID